MVLPIQNALQGKRVLIIGGVGDGSIGRNITRAVGAAGAAGVAVTGRKPERTRAAADEIASPTCKAIGLTGDVQNLADIDRTAAEAVKALGGLDVLITNIGGMGAYTTEAQVHETTDEAWDLMFDVNVKYVFRYCRAVLKVFLQQGTGGTIVSVGSIAGAISMPCGAPYGAAKAALANFCKSLAAEYASRGVRMNVVNCGPIKTDVSGIGVSRGFKLDKVPLGRPGRPEEIAATVVYFASPLSGYVTGQTLNADGGVTVRFPLRLPGTDESMAG